MWVPHISPCFGEMWEIYDSPPPTLKFASFKGNGIGNSAFEGQELVKKLKGASTKELLWDRGAD
jgi:hypothetical protein